MLWKGLVEHEVEIKNRKSFLNLTFGQNSCLILDFARPNSNKAILVQVFSVIFNSNFVFCMMSSLCSKARLAGWILAREIIKCINVSHLCLKKYWKKLNKHLWWDLFRESSAITLHSLLKWIRHLARNLRKVFNEVWKDKKLRKICRNSCLKLRQMNYINCRNKGHMR